MAGCGRESGEAPATTPTYNQDVAPIVRQHCAGCHRPGQGAPFALLTYDDLKQRASDIAEVTGSRQMPPWLPEPGALAFVGERRLSEREIATVSRWVEGGAPEGDSGRRPPPLASTGPWQLGTPDLVLSLPKAYRLRAGGEDVFRNVVLRTGLDADRFVRAVEFGPGAAPVHHAVVHLDPDGDVRERDGADGAPGFDGMGAPGTVEPDGHFVGWAPGRGPIVSVEQRPWKLPRGADLVVELHLIPRAAAVDVQPTVALYFAPAPAATAAPVPIVFKMGSSAIDIPPGAVDYAISDRYVLPADAEVLSLYPHAHYLGKDMQVDATLPDGSTRRLLHIRDWSFHWQQDYRFVTPMALPRGTAIAMRYTYDNTDANPENPHHPPVRVTAGPRSTDEMGNLLVQLAPRTAADRAALARDLSSRDAAANVATAEALVKAEPGNADYRIFLGGSYVDVGRVDEAIAQLERAIQLAPRSARAHNEMGGALLRAKRVAEAVRSFQRAAALRPTDARLQYNLGRALGMANDRAAAAAALERALALDPGLAEAHDELGVLLFTAGRLREAVVHLTRAVELSPESSMFRSDLGGALAEQGQVEAAVTHLRRALELDPANAAARENLARLRR
jgi:Flp pilus assembly protein TadD